MFHSKALLPLILISLSVVDATPVTRTTGKATLNFSTRFNTEGALNIVEKDRARAQALKNVGHLGKRNEYNDSVTNAVVTYTAQVGVGSPAKYYTLLIDTGSSNTWVGANSSNPYVKTGTSKFTGNTVSVMYGSGCFTGEEYNDTVTLGPDFVIEQQPIGAANFAYGFDGVDGILGVGPVDLTEGTETDQKPIPTVMDDLIYQGTISQEVLSIRYVPSSESNSGGTLTFGGVGNLIANSTQYVPLTTVSPASDYWGIDQHISYGSQMILSHTAGIVDTGTTLILIATDAFNMYQSATGATTDKDTGLLTITAAQYANLQPLSFSVGRAHYDLSANAQIWPRSLNMMIGGKSDSIYLVVNDIGSKSGSGLDFINGYTFLERYYSEFDTTNGRVGFAPTPYTNSTKN